MKEYESFGSPKGTYRKYLLKQECLTDIDAYDYWSRLRVRLHELLALKEVEATSDARIIRIQSAAQELRRDINELMLQATLKEFNKNDFCVTYDRYASIVESMECCLGELLQGRTNLSEDAKILQKRNYVDKNPRVDPEKAAATKKAWKHNKHKYRRAIRAFHKSSQGKAFIRNLTRFNTFRGEGTVPTEDDVMQVCKGISSMLTHMLIEMQTLRTAKTEEVMAQPRDEVLELKGLFEIFQNVLNVLVEAYFSKDRLGLAEMLDIIDDYYGIVEAQHG